ncbi:MAG: glycosyltransferase family 4 protein [Acidobacteria bacterium]|jgi:glycosyltransferase involved in cell wall biosynthesis|nr:glycosyltransferase family 4 protein [Acidobacteriota bacterium]
MKPFPKNFIYLWHYLEWGGAQVLFFGLMKEAKKKGEVLAVMPKGSNMQLLKFLNNLGVSYEFFDAHIDAAPADSLKRKLERHWKKLYCEFVLLKYVGKYDLKNSVVHTELAPWQSLWALLWLCRKSTVFMTMHNSLPAVRRWRFLLWKLKFQILSRNKNFHLFTANQDTKESLRPFVSGEFLETVKVIYANINPEEIDEALTAQVDRAVYSKKYNLPKEKFFVFCVGQFIDRKGRWIFLEAAQMLLKDNNDIAFVWISNSKPSAVDLEKAQNFGLGENFRFITSDQVGSEHIDLFKLMRLADVFALPSYLEGLPISIIEAMGLGIPTISTEINAIPEAIKHLQTGLLIDTGNSIALKDAIQKLKDNDELRESLSKNGREYALAKFNEKKVAEIAVESYIEAYQQRMNDN